jgi:hypothetical protein
MSAVHRVAAKEDGAWVRHGNAERTRVEPAIHTNTGTIEDFGDQWQIHGNVDTDYWTDPAILRDYVGPLLDLDALRGKAIAEVGSGSGRIIRMLSKFGPRSLHAVEPSEGFEVLRKNTADIAGLQLYQVPDQWARLHFFAWRNPVYS